MINKQTHKDTQYRIPYLTKEFKKIKVEIADYILLEKDWDSYDADIVSQLTIQNSIKVLDYMYKWFEDNIGFLNNRRFEIDCSPWPCGTVHITILYADCYEIHSYIENHDIKLEFMLKPRYKLEGQYTIADRKTDFWWSGDKIIKKIKNLKQIELFLKRAFYEHKWCF